MFICPLCQQTLLQNTMGLVCINRHQFDRAREGYVNLLPVQHKASKVPGDSAEMMQARRRFLDAGHYHPLRQRICELVDRYLSVTEPSILDIGCGEGYYTASLAQRVIERQGHVYGLDVARAAIKAAAKRYKSVEFCVASVKRLPFAQHQFDAVTKIYAPANLEQLYRVIKPQGYLITVTPGPYHLYQLKQRIYNQVQLHQPTEATLDGFSSQERQQLRYTLDLSSEEALSLLQMTPFAWRAPETCWQYLAEQEIFVCDLDFIIDIWQRDCSV